jgi:hypothetical protein
MPDFFNNYDNLLEQITDKHQIHNLIYIRWKLNFDYWERFAHLSFFEKLFNEHKYHFLYEIQGLSSQIHFGIINCFLFRDMISMVTGRPNQYNHRYTFMIEATIHEIYSYWNRVGLAINTYLKTPNNIKRTYFSQVISQLEKDYPDLANDKNYQWLYNVKKSVEDLQRNEFAHNNSLIMQNFLPKEEGGGNFKELLAMPEILQANNIMIVDQIGNLVELLETLEKLK